MMTRPALTGDFTRRPGAGASLWRGHAPAFTPVRTAWPVARVSLWLVQERAFTPVRTVRPLAGASRWLLHVPDVRAGGAPALHVSTDDAGSKATGAGDGVQVFSVPTGHGG